jgi:NADH:quinone reductase (non-electrogenic)
VRPQLFRTRITELFGIRHPILCGGLIWLADASYVAAAVNAGGMGFITALSFPGNPERLRAEVRKCRTLTEGKAFGVSLAFSARPNVNDGYSRTSTLSGMRRFHSWKHRAVIPRPSFRCSKRRAA